MTEFYCGITLANFEPEEFHCPCCGAERMHPDTLVKLQQVRNEHGKPIGVIPGGGYRCENYDQSQSAHKEGRAVDLSYTRDDHFRLLRLAILHGFTGIGDKNKGGSYQMHVDDAEDIPGVRPRPWKWTYDT